MRQQAALLIVTLACIPSAAALAAPNPEKIFAPETILDVMRRVHDYQASHPWKETDRNWIRATYYTGVMGLYRATGDRAVLDQAVRWAEKHGWAEGNEREPANRKTCGQTYLELYFLDPVPERIAKIRAYVDSRMAQIRAGEPPTKGWYYCDTLYVGPPTLAMLGEATGDSKYYDYLNDVYWAVTDHLFDKDYGLFYRDKSYFDSVTPQGRKVFWSRGNGWVLAGTARVLQHLPKENKDYQRYVDLFRVMCASIARRQGADGLWRSNLDDPHQYPNPETSGTAFFCFAIAWGVNNGVLDRNTYLPVAARAWAGLVRHVHPDGKLGFVQPVGGSPKPATADMTHEYAMGLLLLAGEEMLKLVQSKETPNEEWEKYDIPNPTRRPDEAGATRAASPDAEAKPDGAFFDPVLRKLEGWTVYIDPQLLEGEHRELGRRALTMLANHLQRIAILVPEDRLAKLRKVGIWIELRHPTLRGMHYHPSAGWLKAHGCDPRLAKKVHITHAEELFSRPQMIKHPAVVLHELAHAYHDQQLGFDEPRIKKAYEKAMASGVYENTLLYNGKRVRHYAATDHKEYFAEGTEAFFYRNDFYPFVAAELKEHDPTLYDLLTDIWGPLN